MTETGALSPADVMAMTNSEGLGGNNAFFWIFALLLLGGMGNGGFYGGGYKPQYATQGDVQNSFNFSDLQDQNRDILNAVNSGTAQSVAATSQAKYDNINVMKDVQSALTSQIADANTNAMLAQNRYDLSMQLAGVEQRLMSKMDANEIQNLRDQVSQLQMAQATSGVVRYPNSWTFNAGNFPNCFCGNCG